jgi:hypothetical protein
MVVVQSLKFRTFTMILIFFSIWAVRDLNFIFELNLNMVLEYRKTKYHFKTTYNDLEL